MEVEFIPKVKSACFFKKHHFYVESVAPIFKMEVQSHIPINKDKWSSCFSDCQRTSKTCLKVLSRNCIRPLIWSNVFLHGL